MKPFDPSSIHLYQPLSDSHKGQNGKLLVIGGSKLFHTGIFWAADAASRIVDIVHLTSPANENNQIFRKRLKEKFWSGIVVDWADVEGYIEEDDCILIGPGMIRSEESTIEDRGLKVGIEDRKLKMEKLNLSSTFHPLPPSSIFNHLPSSVLSRWGQQNKTREIVNFLLAKFPTKKWVIDGGGLQEVEPGLITKSCILTPHGREFQQLTEKVNFSENSENSDSRISSENQKARDPENPTLRFSDIPKFRSSECSELSKKLNSCTILLKGPTDTVCQGERCIQIKGGNPGMTKGGTGDVLAGLVAALYCKNDAWTAATVGSRVNKTTGDNLYTRVGHYFNAADLVKEIPNVLVKV